MNASESQYRGVISRRNGPAGWRNKASPQDAHVTHIPQCLQRRNRRLLAHAARPISQTGALIKHTKHTKDMAAPRWPAFVPQRCRSAARRRRRKNSPGRHCIGSAAEAWKWAKAGTRQSADENGASGKTRHICGVLNTPRQCGRSVRQIWGFAALRAAREQGHQPRANGNRKRRRFLILPKRPNRQNDGLGRFSTMSAEPSVISERPRGGEGCGKPMASPCGTLLVKT